MSKTTKLVVGVVVVSFAIIGFLSIYENDFYEDAPHISYNEIVSVSEDAPVVYYYFYREDCSHCQDIKEDMKNFYKNLNDNEILYLIDVNELENSEALESKPYTKEDGLSKLTITGTPTLVETKDGEVTNYLTGSVAIPEYINSRG